MNTLRYAAWPLLMALSAYAEPQTPPEPAHLTPAQQHILQAAPGASPERSFRFDDPAGPQFSDQQKQAQREAGQRVVPLVAEACRSGADSIRIPPGDYRFGREHWGKDGVTFPLEFSHLERDPGHPLTIDATGATFWFDLGDEQAPTAHFCVGFTDCSNLIFRSATIDRGTRGNVEGRITRLDFAENRIEIELLPGSVVPEKFNFDLQQRVLPFKADGRFCAPLYALQRGGVHLKYKSLTPGPGSRRCFVNMADTALLDTIRDPHWLKAYGDLGVLHVGDGLSCVYTATVGLELVRCGNMTVEGVHIYAAKGWGAEWGGDGGHLWKNCYFGPRPGTSQWQGGDGYMFNGTRHGTTLDNVTILHTTDDPANFHGYWGNIHSVAGNRLTLAPSAPLRRFVLPGVKAGERLAFHDQDTGEPLGDAVVTAIDGPTLTLDRSAEPFARGIVEWPDHQCAGWTIQNCNWHDNYQRLLIQSGPGTVRHCTLTRQGHAIELNSVMPYVEGGVPRGITIVDNVLCDVNPQPHGAAIMVYTHTFGAQSVLQFSDIVVRGNTFSRPGEAAIALSHVKGGVISGNRFEHPVELTALARPNEPHRQQAIRLSRCEDFRVEGNTLLDPANCTAPAAGTNSRMLGLDEHCRDITLDGRRVGDVPRQEAPGKRAAKAPPQ